MKLIVKRRYIEIEPETITDCAYLEDTLGFTRDGTDPRTTVVRVNLPAYPDNFFIRITKAS